MKLIVCLLLLPLILNAQTPTPEKEFLEWYFEAHGRLGAKFVYSQQQEQDVFRFYKLQDSLYTYSDRRTKKIGELFVFTKEERMYAEQRINALTELLPDSILAFGTMLKAGSTIKRNASGDYDVPALRIVGVNKIYALTRPIFFRNNTVCLFASAYFCGSLCGEGRLDLYRKVNGKWQLWIPLSSWVS